MTGNTYTLDDLESDLHHLHHLIDVAVDKMQDIHHDGDPRQHQADALAFVARDLSKKVADRVSQLHSEILQDRSAQPADTTAAADMVIALPEGSIAAGDLMDRGLDKLRTIWLALNPDNKGWADADHITSVWGTLERAIKELEPVRNQLQGCGGT